MNKTMARKWVKALRSGKYRQGTNGCLTETDEETGEIKFCCLGVLRDVQGGGLYKDEDTPFLSEKHSCGLSSEEMHELACRNDGALNNNTLFKPHSFKQLAALIERRYLK